MVIGDASAEAAGAMGAGLPRVAFAEMLGGHAAGKGLIRLRLGTREGGDGCDGDHGARLRRCGRTLRLGLGGSGEKARGNGRGGKALDRRAIDEIDERRAGFGARGLGGLATLAGCLLRNSRRKGQGERETCGGPEQPMRREICSAAAVCAREATYQQHGISPDQPRTFPTRTPRGGEAVRVVHGTSAHYASRRRALRHPTGEARPQSLLDGYRSGREPRESARGPPISMVQVAFIGGRLPNGGAEGSPSESQPPTSDAQHRERASVTSQNCQDRSRRPGGRRRPRGDDGGHDVRACAIAVVPEQLPVAVQSLPADDQGRAVVRQPLSGMPAELPGDALSFPDPPLVRLEWLGAAKPERHSARPIGGSDSSPAKTSATWRTAMAEPWRPSLPAMFIRQPRSPANKSSGFAAAALADLLVDHRVGDVGVLDRERAAEAAAYLAVGHLDEFEAGDLGEQRARLALDVELAQARAAVVIGRAARRARRARVHAAHIDQEGGQLVDALGERDGAAPPRRVVLQQLRDSATCSMPAHEPDGATT